MRILSGLQPTGKLHIGNYFGAIKQLVELQENNEIFIMVADLHSMTIPFEQSELKNRTKKLIINCIASGIDPEKSVIFVQSQVPYHSELAWYLSIVTPIGDLQRMHQYKEKIKRFKKNANAGLLNYPILQAADILLYDTDLVPVGEDQLQHIELTREITRRFNKRFGNVFKIPQALVKKESAKIMSLVEPQRKMDKSKPEGCLFIEDETKEIYEKIMKATTDSGKEIIYNKKKKPGISNLLAIYSLVSEKKIEEIEKEFRGSSYENFKYQLATLVDKYFQPIREKIKSLLNQEDYLQKVIEDGKNKANQIASKKIVEVKKALGLI